MLLDSLWVLLIALVFVLINRLWFRLFVHVHVGRKRRSAVVIPIDSYRSRHRSAALSRR